MAGTNTKLITKIRKLRMKKFLYPLPQESNKCTVDRLRKTADVLRSSLSKKEDVITSIRRDIDRCCQPKSINEENAMQRVDILRQRVDKIIAAAATDKSSSV